MDAIIKITFEVNGLTCWAEVGKLDGPSVETRLRPAKRLSFREEKTKEMKIRGVRSQASILISLVLLSVAGAKNSLAAPAIPEIPKVEVRFGHEP